MVSVSLRQKPASATDQNAPVLASIAVSTAVSAAASVRPVSGTPLWARNDHVPGAPRPASPWDEWFIPPKPPELTKLGEHTELTETRKPSPRPTESARHGKHAERTEPGEYSRAVAVAAVPASDALTEPSSSFRPWRIDFARPDIIEYPALPEPSVTESPDPGTVAKRLLLLLGLAYLFIAALTSGLAYTGYLTTTTDNTNRSITSRNNTNHNSAKRNVGDTGEDGDTDGTGGSADSAEPTEGALPPRPPSRHPNAPGLHTRPDGSRYLIMPLPADLADRFRGHTDTDRTDRTARPVHATRAVPAAVAMGGGLL